MRQTLALFLDAYRELNSRKLFWITLTLSLVAAGAMGAFGLNSKGISILWWQLDTPMLTSSTIPPDKFYAFIFSAVGIPIWLTWAANILALISTSSIIPDFIAGGAVELTLSKPVGRARLFLTKYLTGLLFVAGQVTLFSLVSFIIIGVRGKSWEPRLFLAVPIVLLCFSYLFSLCALFGLLTRSTISALLLTLVAWFLIFGLNATDELFIGQREQAAVTVENLEKRIEKSEQKAREAMDAARAKGEPVPGENGTPLPAGAADPLDAASPGLNKLRQDLSESRLSAAKWRNWSGYMFAIKTIVPKTNETTDLLRRNLLSAEDMARFNPPGNQSSENTPYADPAVIRRVEAAKRSRTPLWIIGTSLACEGAVLALACWIFARRDF